MTSPTVGVIPSGEAGASLKAAIESRIVSGEWPTGYRLPGERIRRRDAARPPVGSTDHGAGSPRRPIRAAIHNAQRQQT